jgi:hypothetical protein
MISVDIICNILILIMNINRKALTEINELSKAIDFNDFDYKAWIIDLELFIEKYFPITKENKINNLHQITFEINSKNATSNAQKNTLIKGKQKAKTFINDIIELINQNEIELVLPKSNKRKFLNSGIFWTIITSIAGMFFTIGFTFRSCQFDQEKFNLSEKNKALEKIIMDKDDSIFKLNTKIDSLDISSPTEQDTSTIVIQGS